jgi:hypothetical protein
MHLFICWCGLGWLNSYMRIREIIRTTQDWLDQLGATPAGRAQTVKIDQIQQDMEDEQEHGIARVTSQNALHHKYATLQDLEYAIKKRFPEKPAQRPAKQKQIKHASPTERAWVRKMAKAALKKRSK